MRKRNYGKTLIPIFLLTFTLYGCQAENNTTNDNSAKNQHPLANQITLENPINGDSTDLVEDRSVYLSDKPNELVDIYVTVKKSTKFDMPYTFNQVNSFKYSAAANSTAQPSVEVIFQEGSPKGPEAGLFGFNETKPNALLEARGHSTSHNAQKSYKITLYNKAGLWREMRTINLNKHPYDLTRARNKLSFDLFKTIPNFTSLRTNFVHLHVKDLSEGNKNADYIDYGLFTQIEQPNKKFLRSHGLDPDGYLYKTQSFEFFRYKDKLKDTDESGYSKKDFESVLEIKGRENHKKLLSMLDDVNDYSKDINEVVDKHFNRNNYLTWLAVNILMDNADTNAQNFYLYCATNTDTWYFLPWDYDGAWGWYEQIGKTSVRTPWKTGLANYWGVVLHKRFLQDPENVKALNEKLETLKKLISKEKATALLDSYYSIVSRFIQSNPDKKFLRGTTEEFNTEYKRIAVLPEKNLENYYKNIEKPMPIFLGEPEIKQGKMIFLWDRSFDIQGDDITYDFQIATKPDFSKVVVNKPSLKDTELTIDKLPSGTYYWKVLVKDSKGNTQVAFDTLNDDVEDAKYFGTKTFTIE